MSDDLQPASSRPFVTTPAHVPALDIVILAAGESTRMRSQTPKVLHMLAGRPLIDYSLRLAEALSPSRPVVVVGRNADALMAQVGARQSVAVSMIGKVKTAAQMIAIPLLLYKAPIAGMDTLWIGTQLIYVAAVLTLWSIGYYMRMAWPHLSGHDKK